MTGMTELAGWRQRIRAHLGDVDPATLPEVPQGETAEDRAARLQRQAENRAARWRSMLPVMYAEASLGDLDPQGRSAIESHFRNGGLNLVLAGAVGTGKTHAAYAAGHWLVHQGEWVEAWSVVDLLDALKPNRDTEAEARARECDVLILDDLGATRATDWAAERLLALMDDRLRDERATIFTTNATGEQISDAWGHRLLDRMSYRQTVIKFTGESRRKAAW